MPLRFGKRRQRQNLVLYTIITALLISIVFLSMVGFFYSKAEDEAYEFLHVQTKQIKDDLILQLTSDLENLTTMSNFAAKLYVNGESYDALFESFKPIGLISNIGILTPENDMLYPAGSVHLENGLSFAEEAIRGAYVSGRVKDLINPASEIVRSAAPIRVNGETVGILYGAVRLDSLQARYAPMAENLDAQLFVYDNESGNFVIDSVRQVLSNIEELRNRVYTDGFSYEQMMSTDRGYTSFISAYSGERLYIHYSPVEPFGWTIMLGRPESQVFASAHLIFSILLLTFALMALIVTCYLIFVMRSEWKRSRTLSSASKIRKLLLDFNQKENNINLALKEMAGLSKAPSAVFFDSHGEDYSSAVGSERMILDAEERKFFVGELLRCAAEFYKSNQTALNLICITPNHHLMKIKPRLYAFLKEKGIHEISFAAIVDRDNHIGILGVLNPRRTQMARNLIGEIAVCFSIAVYNRKHLNQTEATAVTDSLTGVSNRVAYKRDQHLFDATKPKQFICLYIDVNELHLRNNKYGHAAGDEMLLYVANTLKDVFFRHHVYRMGGDEFLVFVQDVAVEEVKQKLELVHKQLREKDYHIAVGMAYRLQNTDTEELVREAEVRMYEDKAAYYQKKEGETAAKNEEVGYVQTMTGIPEIDTLLSVMKEHYNGVYRVSLDTDQAYRILMPTYLGYNETEEHFTQLLTKYIDDSVDKEFHRPLTSFINYDALRSQLKDGNTPRISYKKTNGERAILSVHCLEGNPANTLWVFSKADA